MRDRARSVLRPLVSATASLVLVGGLLAVGGSANAATGSSTLDAATLKTDSTTSPLGITTFTPSFSWQAVADADGAVTATVTVPENTAEGAHRIVLAGENPDASIAVALTIDVDTVILPGGLATAGVEIAQTLTLGVLLIGAGLGTWLFFVRRSLRPAGDAAQDEN